MHYFEILETILHTIVPHAIVILELIATFIVVSGLLKAIYLFFVHHFNFGDTKPKIALVDSIALAIDFMLAAEILNTMTIRDQASLIILIAICGIRIVVGFVLEWEKKHHSL